MFNLIQKVVLCLWIIKNAPWVLIWGLQVHLGELVNLELRNSFLWFYASGSKSEGNAKECNNSHRIVVQALAFSSYSCYTIHFVFNFIFTIYDTWKKDTQPSLGLWRDSRSFCLAPCLGQWLKNSGNLDWEPVVSSLGNSILNKISGWQVQELWAVQFPSVTSALARLGVPHLVLA